MAELRLLSDDGGIDIDLVSGVWRVDWKAASWP